MTDMTDILKTKIAILGTTGYIGRALLHKLQQDSGVEVVGYSRDAEAASKTLAGFQITFSDIRGYDDFLDREYDVVINATGVGSPRKFDENPRAVFLVTEKMDDLLLSYLHKHPECRAFNLSSGSVYGRSAVRPIQSGTPATFEVSHLRPGDFYSLAKLYSEAKHRSVPERHIVDLRVFAFVSRFLDLEESFFIAEVAKCLKGGTVFKTKSEDMMRDYATAEDLWDIIEFLMTLPPQNAAFDVVSARPVGKFELLKLLSQKFGLQYETGQLESSSPTGEKNAYYSESAALTDLGYVPERTALQNIEQELTAILSKN